MAQKDSNGQITITLTTPVAIIIAGLFIALAVYFSGAGGRTGTTTTGTGTTGGTDLTTEPTLPSSVAVSVDNDPFLGNADAPITLIEFSDFQCPFCRSFWTDSLPTIKANYIDTGKVKLVYRDFPLSFHPMAQPSAEAAECVREQGGDTAFFDFHDKIFSEQNILDGGDPLTGPATTTVTYTEQDILTWANEMGYNIQSCLDSGKYTSEVESDLADGTAAGVSGTPGFLIGLSTESGVIEGRPIVGAQPYASFEAVIEELLSQV